VTDINGIFRGKRLPAQSADKVFKGAMKLPASTLHVDVFGRMRWTVVWCWKLAIATAR